MNIDTLCYEDGMINELSVGLALKRFRRLNSIKQGDVAERLGVSQGNVSRWESGLHEPDLAHCRKISDLIAVSESDRPDRALKRLVESSTLPVHLVCDATHRLLAASPARLASWRVSLADYLGTSLWRFASPEIVAAEARLAERGWFEKSGQVCSFATRGNDETTIVVRPSTMQWETIPLADGRMARLTTTIDWHA